MPLSCQCENRHLTVLLAGEVDHHGAKRMMKELDEQIEMTTPNYLTLDLSGVTFMDSSGIAVLLRARRRLLELSGGVRVIRVPTQAERVLRAAGVDRLMKFE